MSEVATQPQYQVGSFNGPLDLLLQLIEKNKINIYDIPISTLTEQYLTYLPQIQDQVREEVASDFLVMASTLLYIKSRMLLPRRESLEGEEEDPRAELVMRLLEYRRCKWLAEQLAERRIHYEHCCTRAPSAPDQLGIVLDRLPPPPLDPKRFQQACDRICQRNNLRFQDVRDRVQALLRRDRLPLKARIKLFWQKICTVKQIFFFEILPVTATKAEKVSGFLALLELLRMDQVQVTQKEPFEAILIEKNPQADPQILQQFLHSAPEEDEYV